MIPKVDFVSQQPDVIGHENGANYMAEFYGVPIEDYQEGQKWQMENFPGTLFVVRRADVQYCLADVPEKKSDLVDGKYRLSTAAGGKAAVKITDMLGEEMLMVEG